MAHDKKFDVFISYSRKDSAEVNALVEMLQQRIPDINIWFDIDGIESGDEFEDKIITAIDNSFCVLFALSDNSIASPWTKDEVMYAKNTNIKVIPLLLQGAEMKGWFLFKFGRVDYIDSTSQQHVDKLLKNLSSWTGKAIFEEQIPAAVVEPATIAEEEKPEAPKAKKASPRKKTTSIPSVEELPVVEAKSKQSTVKKKSAPRKNIATATAHKSEASESGLVVFDIFVFELNSDEHTATLVDIRADWVEQQLPASISYAGAEYTLTKIALKLCFCEYAIEAKEISIPEGVKCLGEDTFMCCLETEHIILPSSLEKIASSAFQASGLKSINIPDGITTIESLVFSGTEIESIMLPSQLTRIGSMAFADCNNLVSIVIPDGVTVIDWDAFKGCKSLRSITLPASITNIGRGAFDGCKSLEEIIIPRGTKSHFKKMTGISFFLSFKLIEK